MRTNNMKLEALETPTVKFFYGSGILLLWLLALLIAGGLAISSFAQEAQPKMFASAGEAATALFDAAQKQDEQALEAILGAGKEVTSSSDEVEDKLEREQFTRKYQEMHRLVREPDGNTILYIGAENWPFPISLVSRNDEWFFDSDHGKQEILFRRIGENEATAIDVCEQFALAKNAGEKAASEDPTTQFVQSLVSAGVANAGKKDSDPFHGYDFRIVNANSGAGANSDVSGNNKDDGLALVAFPVDYRTSGVMTFIVSNNGIVYEKDLGSETATLAQDLKRGPDSSWHAAE